MRKILSIEKNPLVKTECWTSECLSIMQTNPIYKFWVASHMEIYLNEKYEAIFGSVNKCFRLIDFSTILSFKEIPIWETSPHKITNKIINEVTNNHYVLIFLTDSSSNFHHEVVTYGFDTEENIFYLYDISGDIGKISFSDFERMYTETYNNLKYNTEDLLYFGTFYPITSISLKSESQINSIDSQIYIEETFRMLDYEYNGSTYLTYGLSDFDNQKKEKLFYTGLYCLLGMKEIIEKCIQDKRFIKNKIFEELMSKIVRSMFKLYEHRSMVLIGLKILHHHFPSQKSNKLIIEYERLHKHFSSICIITLKFFKTADWEIPKRIINDLDSQYHDERKIMYDFLQEIRNNMKKGYVFSDI